jgi:Tfp pilus assembly protein PilO
MKKWPKQHVRLFVALLFLVLVFLTSYLILLCPLAKKVADDLSYIEKTKISLLKTAWPLDPGRLASILQSKKNELDGVATSKETDTNYPSMGIRPSSRRILRHCVAPLNNRMKKLFDTPSDFTKDVARLDYQEEYNQLEQKLATRGIFLSEQILNLGEDSSAKEIYLLLLQVWMLDKITTLAVESGLRVQTEGSIVAQDESGRKRQAAKISFQPICDYRLYNDQGASYVLEIPLKIAVHGNTSSLCAFLAKLQSDGNFFSLGGIQIFSIPELKKTETEFSLRSGYISVELECSAYFSQRDITSSPSDKPAPVKIMPEGA